MLRPIRIRRLNPGHDRVAVIRHCDLRRLRRHEDLRSKTIYGDQANACLSQERTIHGSSVPMPDCDVDFVSDKLGDHSLLEGLAPIPDLQLNGHDPSLLLDSHYVEKALVNGYLVCEAGSLSAPEIADGRHEELLRDGAITRAFSSHDSQGDASTDYAHPCIGQRSQAVPPRQPRLSSSTASLLRDSMGPSKQTAALETRLLKQLSLRQTSTPNLHGKCSSDIAPQTPRNQPHLRSMRQRGRGTSRRGGTHRDPLLHVLPAAA